MKGGTVTHILLVMIVAVIVLAIIFFIAGYVITKGSNFSDMVNISSWVG